MFEATGEFGASSRNCACLTEISFEIKFLFQGYAKHVVMNGKIFVSSMNVKIIFTL